MAMSTRSAVDHLDRDFRVLPLAPVTLAPLPRDPTAIGTVVEVMPHSGGLFPNVRALLGFLAAIQGARFGTQGIKIRRGPNDLWWVELRVPWQVAAVGVMAAGGRPYAGCSPRWHAIPMAHIPATRTPLDGTIVLEDPDQTKRLLPGEWFEAHPLDWFQAIPLDPIAVVPPLTNIAILTAAPFVASILHRTAAFGVRSSVTVVERTRLCPPRDAIDLGNRIDAIDPIESVLLQIDSPSPCCVAYLRGLSDLPATWVARSVDLDTHHTAHGSHGHCLLDLCYRDSLTLSLLSAFVPAGESWLLSPLGSGALGCQRIRILLF